MAAYVLRRLAKSKSIKALTFQFRLSLLYSGIPLMTRSLALDDSYIVEIMALKILVLCYDVCFFCFVHHVTSRQHPFLPTPHADFLVLLLVCVKRYRRLCVCACMCV